MQLQSLQGLDAFLSAGYALGNVCIGGRLVCSMHVLGLLYGTAHARMQT
jgi:hypothetical protein